jgi:uncharacterized membrane-anchored protein
LPDYFESPLPVAEPELSRTDDIDVGAQKATTAPLAFAPKFERVAIAAAVVFQLLVLVTMILGRTVPYIGAQTILLQVEPVDPRDMFRGDYVTLGYAINRIPSGKFQSGQPVYVTLVADANGRHYRAGTFLAEAPASGVFIRGTAQDAYRARFGIESYYVQEGTGHDYERAVRTRNLWAEVALDRQGNPSLRRLVVE